VLALLEGQPYQQAAAAAVAVVDCRLSLSVLLY
jgi:hypothetical protein